LDGRAFECRLKCCSSRLYGYAVALTRDREYAADLFQDCVVRAMARPDAPVDEGAFRAWLFTIMRNLWIDTCRARRRREGIETDAEDAAETAGPASLERMIVNRIAVRQAFARLSDHHRDVLALVDIAGFSYAETADLLDVPTGTVMSRVSRARISLSHLLSDSNVAAFPTVGGGRRNG
jgi:RNA polymerase sigma-70 factor, ECF subfamily